MKEYRQNSHTRSLAFWAVLCTATAVVLFVHSHKIVSRALRLEEILGGVALLIFGPVALAVYLIRARMLWASVDPERGVLVSGRRWVEWGDIYHIERRRPLFRKYSGPARVPAFDGDALTPAAWGCTDIGCGTGVGEFFAVALIFMAVLVALWFICFVFVPLVVLPLLEVFVPFGDRIELVTRQGSFVFRDLSDADEFERRILDRPRRRRS